MRNFSACDRQNRLATCTTFKEQKWATLFFYESFAFDLVRLTTK